MICKSKRNKWFFGRWVIKTKHFLRLITKKYSLWVSGLVRNRLKCLTRAWLVTLQPFWSIYSRISDNDNSLGPSIVFILTNPTWQFVYDVSWVRSGCLSNCQWSHVCFYVNSPRGNLRKLLAGNGFWIRNKISGEMIIAKCYVGKIWRKICQGSKRIEENGIFCEIEHEFLWLLHNY